MKTSDLDKYLKGIVIFLLSLTVGFGIPYLIQIKYTFFGANIVTIGDIMVLWIFFPILCLVLGFFIYVANE